MTRATPPDPARIEAIDPARPRPQFRSSAHLHIPAPAWQDTVPSELGAEAVADPVFREFDGLSIREVRGADLFARFKANSGR